MTVMRYQTVFPIAALALSESNPSVVTLPPGIVLDSISCTKDGRFLVIEADGEKFQVFETDFWDCCTAHSERGPR